METKHKILELREKLDRALDLPNLSNDESIKSLVKNQLLISSESLPEEDIEKLVIKRTKEVSNFLEMLRSASGNERKGKLHEASHIDWKVKQDTDQLRVMYCEGPHGSPFHTLLTEGIADGPIDVCVCVSWESFLYSKWWPQYNLPTFKIIASTCLQKVRVGEEISLLRMKVPWPISDREAVLHYFEIEYFEEDLILVLIKTISDTEGIDLNVDGVSRNGIPEAKDTIRIDVVGGFAMQKVDLNRCYFRLITNIDMKLDFVSPSLINFISRQLIGSGYKLFQKAVCSAATSDEDYSKALERTMYSRIREGMVNRNRKMPIAVLHEQKPVYSSSKEHEHKDTSNIMPVTHYRSVSGITEEYTENKYSGGVSADSRAAQDKFIGKVNDISPEVQHALDILENLTAIYRSYVSQGKVDVSTNNVKFSASEENPETDVVIDEVEQGLKSQDDEPKVIAEAKLPAGSSSSNNTKSSVAPEERPKAFVHDAVDTRVHSDVELMQNSITMIQPPLVESMNKVCDERTLETRGFDEKDPCRKKLRDGRKTWLCCFNRNLSSG